jgi:hypothetical protein
LGDGWRGGRAAGSGLRPSLQEPQALFELSVAVLQLLILASELAQLIFELLDPHFRVGVIGLRRSLRGQREQRRECHGAGKSMKSR